MTSPTSPPTGTRQGASRTHVLVTGALGFIGSRTVSALLDRGCRVRAMVRSGSSLAGVAWGDRVTVHEGDLLEPGSLAGACDGVDAVVHLAAKMDGDDQQRMSAAVVGTKNLLDAMAGSSVRRFVLASSFSVYDWERVGDVLDEDCPLFDDGRRAYDSYAVAKLKQEELVRAELSATEIELVVLRPGIVWGRGHSCSPDIAQRVGPFHLVIGPKRIMRLAHVANCADAIATATVSPRAAGLTSNVTDRFEIANWDYVREYLHRSGDGGIPIPVPYWIGLLGSTLAAATVGPVLRWIGRTPPGLFVPQRFRARFKPVRVAENRIQAALDWRPPHALPACLAMTFGSRDTGSTGG